MIEPKTDSIATLLPVAPRPSPSSVAFAPYLDRAWSFTATTAAAPGSTADDARASPSRAAPASRDTREALPPERRTEDRRQDRPPQRVQSAGSPPDEPDEPSPARTESVTGDDEKDAMPEAPVDHSPQDGEDTADRCKTTDAVVDDDAVVDIERHDDIEEPRRNSDEPAIAPEDPDAANPAQEAAGAAAVAAIAGDEAAADGGTASTADVKEESSQSHPEPTKGTDEAAPHASPSRKSESAADVEHEPRAEDAADHDGHKQDGSHRPSGEPPKASTPRARRGKASKTQETASTHVAQQAGPRTTANAEHAGQAAGSAAATAANAMPPGHVADVAPPAMETNNAGAPAASGEAPPGGAGGEARAAGTEPGARTGPAAPGAAEAPEADPSTVVDRVRFVQRVARAFQATGDRGGTVRLRLSPPELGSLRVEITVRHGALSARLEAETEAARQLLLDNLPMLRDRLAEQDIKVEQFQVDLSDRRQGDLTGGRNDGADAEGTSADSGRHRPGREAGAPSADPAGRPVPRRWGEAGQLDIFI